MGEKWYAAVLLVKCRVEDGQDKRRFTVDEQVHVLLATDDAAAYEKAVALGKREETSYQNVYGQNVYWEFVGISELTELTAIEDGMEVYSRLFKSADPARLVQKRSDLLHEQSSA